MRELDRGWIEMMTESGVGMAIAALLMPAAWTQAAESKPDKPNILFALADDWGWPHAGVYGDKVVKTPHFDRLAREGVLFEHAYVSAPSCTPSRNAVLTGQQFYRLGPGANLHGELPVEHPNFMHILRENGYNIGHVPKAWGPGNWKRGGYKSHPCGPERDLESVLKEDGPFCFWLGTHDPHRGYKYGSGAASGMDLSKIEVPPFFPDTPKVRNDIADYYFEVERWDRDVGKAIKQLEEAGKLENTIIVMTGDHGWPFPRGKGNLYDHGVRVPLAVRWGKNVKGGRVLTDFVSFTDLAPTFLDAAGIPVPEAMTGSSLVPILTGDEEGRVDPDRDFVVFGKERHVPAQGLPSLVGYPCRGLRTDGWLLIHNFEPDRWPAGVRRNATHHMDVHPDCDNGPTKLEIIRVKEKQGVDKYYDLCFGKRPEFELYDCKADPFQINNLAGNPENADTLKSMQDRLRAYLKTTDDPRMQTPPGKPDELPFRPKYREKIDQRINRHQK